LKWKGQEKLKIAPKIGEQISRKTPLANPGTDVIIKLKWVLKVENVFRC
jgi:hypothetical protein